MTTRAPLWRNRIVGHSIEDPESLLANPFNFRIHSLIQQRVMTDVLERIGWLEEVIVNDLSGRMINGHLRTGLALDAGEPVPVNHVELDDEEEKVALAYFDQIGGMAGIDTAKLAELMDDLPEVDAESQKLLADLVAKGEPKSPNQAPESGLKYLVLISCTDEQDQSRLLERLIGEGRDCKAMIG